jgi:predicted DCC family thiol-disulfide oxidoreductase YuxK
VEERTNSKSEVFYDGRCPMCASLMGRVERSSKRSQFDLRDMRAEKHLPFKREAVEREVHVIGHDGEIYKGAHGILKIAGEYRGLAFVEKIGTFPVSLQAGDGKVEAM